MNNHIALISTILVLGGCASQVADSEGREALLPTVQQGDDLQVIAPSMATEAYDPEDVQLSFSAVDADNSVIALSGCRMFSRYPGDHTGLRTDDVFNPVCANDEDGITRLPVDSNSEVVFAMTAPGFPNTISHVRTSDKDMDLSQVAYRLLDEQRIGVAYYSAQLRPLVDRSSVIVETDVDGASYELLLHTTDQGPDAIYLDADANVVDSASAGGWAVFPNVEAGMHAVSFGHPTLNCQQLDSMGWGGWQEGTTTAWTITGYATHLAAISCND